ncbi:MBL fold metallo-hydrolase [Candidatus Woesearchaeota archaeon]|nr:MBL fold metallo-hydrolase [Candidatus Woesearchaeota archaeon]
MIITWFGHASFLIETGNKTIYIDPYMGEYKRKADIILVSHGHYDHYSWEKINQLRMDHTAILSTREVANRVDGAKALNPGDKEEVEGIKIEAVEAYSVTRSNHPKGSVIGFVIEAEKKRVYFAGDTDLIPEMKEIKADIALVPVSGTYVMNYKEAVECVKRVKPATAIPMHYGAGIAGTIEDAERFKEQIEFETDTKVEILEEGKSFEIK